MKTMIAALIDPLPIPEMPVLIAGYLAFINWLAFMAFGFDKRQARNGQWRTQESTLLRLAFLGGTPGAYLGRKLFRHKTRKQPFCSNLNTIAFVQVIAIGVGIGWYLGVWDFLLDAWHSKKGG